MFGIRAVRISVLCAGLCAMASVVSAQTKVAIINMQRAVLESDEIKKASAELEAKFRPRQAEVQKVERELQGIQQQLTQNAGKLSPQQEGDLQATGTRRQRDYKRMTDDLQADVDSERNEVLGKSQQQMIQVVKQVAEAKGYDVVVDVQTTVYFKTALDITPDAIAAYNKAYPAAK